ncbi:unnamed protein product [Brachionus calyciflorus]|uniref:Snake toxin/toxin-like domain-containing protein n=1 Tax=Brachionus calyciflorus TaxID=104777 RepID=A0A813X3U6_9BILA|nr:unnamed protein product [Brachionus calyciflorus]
MFKKLNLLLAFLSSLAILFNNTNATKCYECNNCPIDSVKNVAISDCPSQFCLKVVSSVAGRTSIEKKCSRVCLSGEQNTLGVSIKNYCCGSNLCNSTSKSKFNYFITLSLFFSFIFCIRIF